MSDYFTEPRQHYRDAVDEHARQRCVVDFHRPDDMREAATVIFFHGGGLVGGEPYVPEPLMRSGFAVATCGYRLHPHVACPVYIDDAAAAVAWVIAHVRQLGGDSRKIIVSGFSAGSYLVLMLALDKTYLARHGVDADEILGYVPLSGQAITHMAVRAGQGHTPPDWRPTIDRFAPLYHVRPDARPILCVTGDWPLDIHCRAYENAYLVALLKHAGHRDVEHVVLPGVGHEETNPQFWTPALPFMRRLLDAGVSASTTSSS